MSTYDTSIDWPEQFPRTAPGERSRSSKFSASLGDTTAALETEMNRLGAGKWRASIGNSHTKGNSMPRHNANPDDPGFVIRWHADGTDYAAACDQYTRLRDNVRAVYLWINETRMREDRPVVTGGDAFAAAALPPGDTDGDVIHAPDPEPREEPYEVLNVSPGAPRGVVRAAARSLKKDAHPDNGGSMAELKRIEHAEEAMLDE